MANRYAWDVQSLSRQMVIVAGQLTLLGNTTPGDGTFSVDKGGEGIASVARTGTGAYQVTLKDSFPDVLAVNVSIFPHGGAARGVKMGAVDAAAKTINFTVTNTAEAAVETPNGETDRVHLIAFCKNTTVTR